MILCQLVTMFWDIHCSPKRLYDLIRKSDDRLYDLMNGKKQDAHEIMKVLLEVLNRCKHSGGLFRREVL